MNLTNHRQQRLLKSSSRVGRSASSVFADAPQASSLGLSEQLTSFQRSTLRVVERRAVGA